MRREAVWGYFDVTSSSQVMAAAIMQAKAETKKCSIRYRCRGHEKTKGTGNPIPSPSAVFFQGILRACLKSLLEKNQLVVVVWLDLDDSLVLKFSQVHLQF